MEALLPGIVRLPYLCPERPFVDMSPVARAALLRALQVPVPRPTDPEPNGSAIYLEALRTWEEGGAHVHWELVQNLRGIKVRPVYVLSFDDILVTASDQTFFGVVASEPIWRWNHFPFAQSVFYGLIQLTPNVYMRHPEILFRRLNKLALRLAEDAGFTLSRISLFHLNLALYERLCGLEYDCVQRTDNYRRNILDNSDILPLEDRQDRARCFRLMLDYLKSHIEDILSLGALGRPFDKDEE